MGRDTVLARIVEMVATPQRSRAPIQRLADRVAPWFVPAVLVVAALAFVVRAVVGPEPSLDWGFISAVSVLLIACACAATPMAVMTATGRGAQAGVLVRDAAALEALAGVDTLVVDKTGTLTAGKPELVAILPRARRPATARSATSAGTCSSPSPTTPPAPDRGGRPLPGLRPPGLPDARRRRDESLLGLGRRQRAEAPGDRPRPGVAPPGHGGRATHGLYRSPTGAARRTWRKTSLPEAGVCPGGGGSCAEPRSCPIS